MMDSTLGLSSDQLVLLAALGVILLLGLVALRFFLKLTMNLVKIGCLVAVVVMVIAVVLMMASPG
jgi:hypothetical protein